MKEEKINQFSNSELESRLKNFTQQERKLLHVILEHIKEIETRRIYLSRAYPSMFEYLVKECGYSAARLLSEIPELKTKIEEGTINLSQLGELSKALKEKLSVSQKSSSHTPINPLALDKINLVTAICGKSTSETQKILSLALDLPILKIEKQRHQKDDSVRLEITLSKEQLARLKNCHTQQFWEITSFRHSLTKFPLRGAHRVIEYSDCHLSGIYKGLNSNCYLCHKGDFDANPSPHTSGNTNCIECHKNTFTFGNAK